MVLEWAKRAVRAKRVVQAERAANAVAHVSQQLLAQEAHSDELLQHRLGQESTLAAMTAESNSQRAALQAIEDEATGIPGGSASPSTTNMQYDITKVPGAKGAQVSL